jgi:hypothetical protein
MIEFKSFLNMCLFFFELIAITVLSKETINVLLINSHGFSSMTVNALIAFDLLFTAAFYYYLLSSITITIENVGLNEEE